jgi:hypothetical protein
MLWNIAGLSIIEDWWDWGCVRDRFCVEFALTIGEKRDFDRCK